MKNLRLLLFLASALCTALACQSETEEANINQDKYIDAYITSNFADNQVYYEDGVCRVVLQEGAQGAPVIERGDSVFLYYAAFTFTEKGPSAQFAADSGMVRVGTGDLVRGLDTGLPGARLGEEALIIFSADDGFGNKAVGIVPENTALLYDVGIGAIKKNK